MSPSDIPVSGAPPGPGGSTLLGKKLDSWGEIASYLGREVRTVQRWERTEGLPVHRHEHKKKSTVYAYAGELDAWIKNRQPKDDPEADDAFARELELSGADSPIDVAESPVARPAPGPTPRRVKPPPPVGKYVVVAVLTLAILGAISLGVYRWLQPVATEREKVRIAVLPFTYLSGDSKPDYITEGLTDVIRTALGQLDPNRFGMAITIAQCMPSRDGKVRSLRERMGQGTPPWRANLENEPLFLGAESLAGYAIARGHLLVIPDRSDQTMRYPAQWVQWEESAVACPIYQEGLIAGCLLVSSTQQGYFHPFQQTLIERYAELLGLAFASEELYDSRDIELLFIPSATVQHVYRSRLREHVSALLLEASQQNRPLTVLEAEEMAWRQIEEELLAHPIAADNEHPE